MNRMIPFYIGCCIAPVLYSGTPQVARIPGPGGLYTASGGSTSSISATGDCGAASNTCNLSATATGDLQIRVDYRNNSATAPARLIVV